MAVFYECAAAKRPVLTLFGPAVGVWFCCCVIGRQHGGYNVIANTVDSVGAEIVCHIVFLFPFLVNLFIPRRHRNPRSWTLVQVLDRSAHYGISL
jgi:hypothetical protein